MKIKKTNILYTFITVLMLAVVLAGCKGNNEETGSPDSVQENEASKDGEVIEEKEDIEDKADGEKAENEETEDDLQTEVGDISYTYTNHTIELCDQDDKYASGNYYTLELDESIADDFSELKASLDKYNSEEEDMVDYVKDCEVEVGPMREEGFMGNYEEFTAFHPVRADRKAFSFMNERYSYYGGAHGTTTYFTYNFDPVTGGQIAFTDVISDTDGLADIIVSDLLDQNEDLVGYFEELTSDKENLIADINDRIDNESRMMWTVDYDGVNIYFEDYAMGAYVAGTREVKLAFAKHPDIFADEYIYEKDGGRIPDINSIAKQGRDADTVKLQVSGTYRSDTQDTKETPDRENEKPAVKAIKLDKDEQKKINIFLSNFAEQGFQFYDNADKDISELAHFAYIWSRINKPDNVKVENVYYTVSIKNVEKIVNKYFDTTITDDDFISLSIGSGDKYEGFRMGEKYCVPAADGESYPGFAVVESVEDGGNGLYWVYFATYDLDMDIYWDNDEVIPKKYYSYTKDEAKASADLTETDEGMAILKKDGDTYKLQYYKMYGVTTDN